MFITNYEKVKKSRVSPGLEPATFGLETDQSNELSRLMQIP
jgi:hypothetical protein